MKAESRMFACLVCHTEPDVWDGGFSSIDHILPRFAEMIATVRDSAGATPRVAWCLTSEVARQRPEPFRKLLECGHEIGVHSHCPQCESGGLEHHQDLDRNNLDEFPSWFPKLCSHIADAGFPPPRTHATWMFAYRDSMTRVLADAGIRVDCSVCYGGAHYLPDGYLLADSRKRLSGKPYRLAEDDHCAEGDSPVVELPVSGGFSGYWEPDGTGGFRHFETIETDEGRDRQRALFQARLDGLVSGKTDIFHVHFHLYDFLPPDRTGPERLKRARSLLDAMAHDERVRFATPSDAVEAWSKSQERGRQSRGHDANKPRG